MTFILNIETSTKQCSVSVALNGRTIAIKEMANEGYSHAEKLHVFIDDVLQEAQVKASSLNAIAVSQGPGSYTGLRIGISAAKGLCFALDIPLIAIDTLKVLASQVKHSENKIIPMLDARRMEVYSAIFDSDCNQIRETRAEILDDTSFTDIQVPVFVVGDCQDKCKTMLTYEKFIFLDKIQFPSANEMSSLSFEKFKMNEFEDLAYFTPLYLKEFLITKSKKALTNSNS
jgi:tRNA threonylcarbamoyladenosine biosynthesis protein TsaB